MLGEAVGAGGDFLQPIESDRPPSKTAHIAIVRNRDIPGLLPPSGNPPLTLTPLYDIRATGGKPCLKCEVA